MKKRETQKKTPERIRGFTHIYTDEEERQYGIIDLEEIHIPSFQRRVIRQHKIRGAFDRKLCMSLILSYRGGIIWIVDGRQRLEALRARKETKWTGYLFTGLSKEQEAEAFVLLNDVPMRLSSWTRFLAGLEAGMAFQTTCRDEIVKRNLTYPGLDGLKAKDADITSVSALQAAYDAGISVLRKFLSILNQAWREDQDSKRPVQKMAKEVELLRVLVEILKKKPEVPTQAWIDLFSRHEPAAIMALAGQQQKSARITRNQLRTTLIALTKKL